MADKKITQLTNITGANLVDADEFVVVDISADETKAITLGELKEAFDSGSGFVRITGDTMTGDLALSGADVTFGDNDKAIFGAGSDLQIYHNGSHSLIEDSGQGDLKVRGANLKLQDPDGNDFISMTDTGVGGTVELKNTGTTRLATTSTGVDITGTLTSDGLTMGDGHILALGDSSEFTISHTSGGNTNIAESGSGNLNISARDLLIQDVAGTSRLKVDGNLGDISFYDSAGSSQSFFWDASAEMLTTSGLTVDQTSGYVLLQDLNAAVVSGTDMGGVKWRTGDSTVSGSNRITAAIRAEGDGTFNAVDKAPTKLVFSTHGNSGADPVDRMTINSDGDISFYEDTGTTAKLQWSASNERLFLSGSDYQLSIGQGANQPWYNRAVSDGSYRLHLNGTGDIVTLDSSGQVGIGTSSPSNTLHLSSTSPQIRLEDTNATGYSKISGSSANIYLQADEDNTVANSKIDFRVDGLQRMVIDSDGDISFYEDTGTTAKFFWDASGESLTLNSTLKVEGGTTNGFLQASGSLFQLGASTASDLVVYTNNTEQMRITSSGQVGIGTSSPKTELNISANNSGQGAKLTIENTDTSITTNDIIGQIDFYANDASTNGTGAKVNIKAIATSAAGSNTALTFGTSNTTSATAVEAMRIDSSGRVGIGTTSPATSAAGTVLKLERTGSTRLNISAANVSYSAIDFGDTDDVDVGRIEYYHANNAMFFHTNAAERMRIDSSGNLLVGKTSAGYATDGFEARASGYASVSDSGATPFLVNRNTDDGNLISFYKSGATVGSIGTLGRLTIGNAASGISFNSSTVAVQPHNLSTNLAANGTVSLGVSGARFKDLYLSGGVYLGGTGAANKLDDYEEGQYDATIACGTSGTITLNASFNRASYVKVGSLVHVQGLLVTSAVSSPTGYFGISLPFAVASLTDRAGDSSGSILVHGSSANVRDYVCMINEGLSQLLVYLGDATTRQEDSANAINTSTQINFQCSYRTT